MNYLPLILIAVLLMKNSSNALDFIKGLDLDGLSPILSMLGIDKTALTSITELLSGSGDLKSLLPTLLNAFASSKISESSNLSSSVTPTQASGLNPIKDVAGSQIISTLGNYFEQ